MANRFPRPKLDTALADMSDRLDRLTALNKAVIAARAVVLKANTMAHAGELRAALTRHIEAFDDFRAHAINMRSRALAAFDAIRF